MPALSDRASKRKPYFLLGVLGIILGREYWILLISAFAFAFAFGFLLVGIAPIGYQYAAELTYPVSEGTSNGMLILAGLMLVNALLITRLKESELIASPVRGDSQPG